MKLEKGMKAPDFELKNQDGKIISLKDFKVGETVKVKWRSTPKGHVIEALSAR